VQAEPTQTQPPAGEAAVLLATQAPNPAGARSDAQRVGSTPATRATAHATDLSSILPTGPSQATDEPNADGAQEETGEAGAGNSPQANGATASVAPSAAAAIGSESSSLQASVAEVQVAAAATGNVSSQAPATPAAGVGMHEMIESIRATIEISVRQGQTQARIALQPQELGQISIRISQTSQGLLARVSADTPAAAQALAEGRSELRQSLSSLGLPLTLDISAYGESEARERQERFTGEAAGSSNSSDSQSSEDGDGAEPVAAPAGALVDVLA
jgi:type III secretion system needle length determinant